MKKPSCQLVKQVLCNPQIIFFLIQIVLILAIATVYKFQQQGFGINLYDFQSSEQFSDPPRLPETYTLLDQDRDYFTTLENGTKCFTVGTLLDKSGSTCRCAPNYYGADCGIPKVFKSPNNVMQSGLIPSIGIRLCGSQLARRAQSIVRN